jgi:hypothetical protein
MIALITDATPTTAATVNRMVVIAFSMAGPPASAV